MAATQWQLQHRSAHHRDRCHFNTRENQSGLLLASTIGPILESASDLPRKPLLFSGMALVGVGITVWRLWDVKAQLRQLRLGRDGERCVGQLLGKLCTGVTK